MNDLLQPSIQDVNERMCGNCDALVCAGCPVYEMDKLAALRARVRELEQERDALKISFHKMWKPGHPTLDEVLAAALAKGAK